MGVSRAVAAIHHFVSTSPLSTFPLEQVLRKTVLVSGKDAVLIVDDVALHKQGRHSVGSSGSTATCWANSLIFKCWSR